MMTQASRLHVFQLRFRLLFCIVLCQFFLGCSSDEANLSETLPSDGIERTQPSDGIESFAIEIDEESITDVSSINASAYVITGSCDPSASSVTVTVSSPEQSETVACLEGEFSVTFDLTELTSTTLTVVAEQGGESDSPEAAPVNDQSSAAVTVESSPDVAYANHLAYSPSGFCSEEGQPVIVVIGGVAANPQPNCVGGEWSVFGMDLSNLPDGTLQMTVDHSDSLGNAAPQVIVAINKDVEAPSVITAPTAPNDPNWPLKLRPGDLPNLTSANASSFRFAGYCASGQGDINIIFGSLSFIVPCNDFFGFYEYTADVSSETGSNPIQHCATQSTSPVICANPVSNELAPPGLVFDANPLQKITSSNASTYSVRGSCAPEGASIAIDIGSSNDIITGTCNSDNRFILSGDVSSIPDGIGMSVLATISAASGSVDVPASVTKGVLVSLDTPENIILSNLSSYGLSGTCSDDSREVVLNISGYVPATQPACNSGTWSISGLDLSSVADGSVNITVDHTDEFGNAATQQTATVLKDGTAPVVVIASAPNINLSNENSYALSGFCSENGAEVTLNIGGFAPSPQPSCASGAWSLSGLEVSSVPAGTVSISAAQTDAAGNFLSVSVDISKDTTAPTVTLSSPTNITSANASSYSVNGTCSENGESVVVSVGGLSPSGSILCSSGAWSVASLDVSSLPNGAVTVTADHTDSSGNSALQASASVTKFDPFTFNVTSAECANPYVDFSGYTFSGDPSYSYDASTGDLSVTGVSSWRTLAAQTALPEDFEISFTLSSDTRQMVGFAGTSTPSTTWTGIESLLLFYNNAYTYRYANGSYQGNFLDSTFGGFPADVRIEKIGGTARYYVNDTLVHTDTTIPTGVSMYLTFAGLTGYTAVYKDIKVRDMSLPESGYFVAGTFNDPSNNGPYELYDATNDVVVGAVSSPFNVEYSSGLNGNADLVVRSTSNASFSSVAQTVTLSDCLKPLELNLSGAGCFGPTTSVADYSFAGSPTFNYESSTDTFTVTGGGAWRTLAAQEILPSDFNISFSIASDAIQVVGFAGTSTPSTTWTGLESAMLFYTNSNTYFYANGTYQGNVADSTFGGFPADVRIEKIGATARFYVNDTLVRTDNTIAAGNMYLTFAGHNSSYSASYQNFKVEDISSSADYEYQISGLFEDPNGMSGTYELYDVTNDVVIGEVTSPFEVLYNSGANSAADIVIRRVGAEHVASPNTNITLSTCD